MSSSLSCRPNEAWRHSESWLVLVSGFLFSLPRHLVKSFSFPFLKFRSSGTIIFGLQMLNSSLYIFFAVIWSFANATSLNIFTSKLVVRNFKYWNELRCRFLSAFERFIVTFGWPRRWLRGRRSLSLTLSLLIFVRICYQGR